MDIRTSRGNSNNFGEKSVFGLIWAAFEVWGGQLISLSIYIFLARMLVPTDFGLIAMAGVYMALVKLFVDQGLSVAIVQREDLDNSHLNSVFWLSLFTSIVLFVVTLWLSASVAAFFKQDELANIIQVLAFITVFNSLSCVPVGLMRRKLQFKPLAARSIISTVVGGVVALVMAYRGYGVWCLVYQQITSGLIRLVLVWLQTDWRPSFQFKASAMKDLLPFSLSMLGNSIVTFGNKQGDKLLVGIILGPVSLGYYALGQRFYTTLRIMLTGFVQAVSISSFSSLQKDIDRLRRVHLSVTGFAASVAFPIYGFTILLCPIIVPLVLGDKWTNSVVVLQIFCLVGALESLTLINSSVLIALGKPHWLLALGVLGLFISISGYLLFGHFGIEYFAAVYAFRSFFLAPLQLVLLRRLTATGIKPYVKRIYVATLCTVVVVFGGYVVIATEYVLEKSLYQLISLVFVFGVLYVFVVMYLDRNTLQFVKKTLGKIAGVKN